MAISVNWLSDSLHVPEYGFRIGRSNGAVSSWTKFNVCGRKQCARSNSIVYNLKHFLFTLSFHEIPSSLHWRLWCVASSFFLCVTDSGHYTVMLTKLVIPIIWLLSPDLFPCSSRYSSARQRRLMLSHFLCCTLYHSFRRSKMTSQVTEIFDHFNFCTLDLRLTCLNDPCIIGSRALSFSDPYIHFACLSVRHSVILSVCPQLRS